MQGLANKSSVAALVAAVLATTGCASGSGPSLSLPEIPKLESVAAITVTEEAPVGSATEIYTRVARGAMTCWFAANGPLKKDYIYHAAADAPSRGGKAEIVVHVRDTGAQNPRGAKAYRINIDPTGENAAAVKTENLKMSDAYAAAMAADVGRWSRGDQGCRGASTVVGWSAPANANAEEPKVDTKKPKKTAAVKPRPSQ